MMAYRGVHICWRAAGGLVTALAAMLAVPTLGQGNSQVDGRSGALSPATAASQRQAPATQPPLREDNTQPLDDVAATERSVVRVVTVAIVNGEVVGFGHGSGFAVAPNRIVTNAHVVSDAAEYPQNVSIGIVPSEGSRSYPGRLIRLDRRRDLAIIEIVEGRVPAASIYIGPVAQRSTVFALGYPGNVDLATAQRMEDFIRPRSPVASDGIVSSFESVEGVTSIVHDADIARGNSGGPLVDRCGRVIGVNSAITRADEGDSPFSFAVTVRELAAFLQDAGQAFTGVASPCVTAAEARSRSEEQTRASMLAREADRRASEARNAALLSQLRLSAQTRSETYIAVAFGMFGITILAGGASFVYQVQGKARERRIAIVSATLLAIGAVIIFALRPNPADVVVPDPAAAIAPSPGAANDTNTGVGALMCTLDRDRGRVTVSTGEDTPLDFAAGGCVNGRTQYVSQGDGSWSRTLVPNEEATVSRVSYNPATREYVVRRYLLPLRTMQNIRAQRAQLDVQNCTASRAALTLLSQRELAIETMLPSTPNEELVHRCVRAPADRARRMPPRPDSASASTTDAERRNRPTVRTIGPSTPELLQPPVLPVPPVIDTKPLGVQDTPPKPGI